MTAPVCPTCGQPTMSAERRLREEVRDAVFASERTQKDLSEAMGVTQKHMSQVLNGHSGLSLTFAEQLLAILGRRINVTTAAIGEQL